MDSFKPDDRRLMKSCASINTTTEFHLLLCDANASVVCEVHCKALIVK